MESHEPREIAPVRRLTRLTVALVALQALSAAGCNSGAAPSNQLTSSPHSDPVATLAVVGSGTVRCTFPEHGCQPTLVLAPGSWTPPASWLPAPEDAYFATERHDGVIWVTGPVIAAPTVLTPGHYTVGIGVAESNDVIGGDKYVGAHIDCLEEFNVTFGQAVQVTAVYGEPCRLDVSVSH
ncbi:MAG: hypothetical protein ABI725_07790 [Chloroflexota bacterium]